MRRAFLPILLIAAWGLTAGPPALAVSTFSIVQQVSLSDYTNYLDNLLYTHNGHNRGLGGAHHDLARTNIYNAFVDFGLETSLDDFVYNGSTYYNVVAVQRGLVRPDEIYIIGAHYDSVNNPGADDNASGVAAVLEAASVLSQYAFASTLVYIAFDREEQGLKGSWAYANEHAGDNILGMVSLDMIAYNPPGPTYNMLVLFSPGKDYGYSRPLKESLAAAISLYGDGLTSGMEGELGASDHEPFRRHGYQSALMSEASVMSNPHYHKATDSVDTPDYIDYLFATRATRSIVGFLADKAGPTPEPSTIVLLVAGLAVLLTLARRKGLADPRNPGHPRAKPPR